MRVPLRTCTCVREGVKAEIAGCVVFVILFWQIPEVCQTRHLSQHVAPQTPARTLGCQCKLRPLPSPQLRPYSNLLWRVKHPSKTPVPICVPDVFTLFVAPETDCKHLAMAGLDRETRWPHTNHPMYGSDVENNVKASPAPVQSTSRSPHPSVPAQPHRWQ